MMARTVHVEDGWTVEMAEPAKHGSGEGSEIRASAWVEGPDGTRFEFAVRNLHDAGLVVNPAQGGGLPDGGLLFDPAANYYGRIQAAARSRLAAQNANTEKRREAYLRDAKRFERQAERYEGERHEGSYWKTYEEGKGWHKATEATPDQLKAYELVRETVPTQMRRIRM